MGWPVSGLWGLFVLTIVNVLQHGSHIQQWIDLRDAVTASCGQVWGLERRLGCIWNEDISSEMMCICGMTSIRSVIVCANNSEGFAWVTHEPVRDLQNNVTASCGRVWGLGRRLGCIWNEDISSEMICICGMSSIWSVIICANHSEGFAWVTHSPVSTSEGGFWWGERF